MLPEGNFGPSSAFESPTFDKDVSIHVNEAIGAASISPSGRDVVLASRVGLFILDLDQPYSPPRHISNRSQWEVADVQWSPFASRAHWIVSTSNQKALVYNLELPVNSLRAPIEFTLHAHSRAITDINFSAHHPDELATCAVDSFVHCWDLRQPARPSLSLTATIKYFNPFAKFADWDAGATQVKWNRQEPNIIASSHDKYLRIWDRRKGAFPLKTIAAHSTKIYGIDWNRTRSTGILTCSLDKTIKIWDYEQGDDDNELAKPERVFQTKYPVWRARHTPFGWGVLAMPQGDNHDLHLYDRRLSEGMSAESKVKAVHKFQGHTDSVKEFLWRTRGNIDDGVDNRDFQLVSWGTDRHLHLFQMKAEYLEAVGYEKGKKVFRNPATTRQGAVYMSYNRPLDLNSLNRTQPRPPANDSTRARGQLSTLFQATNMSTAETLTSQNLPERGTMSVPVNLLGRHKQRKVVNTIQWMKGVKIGTRDTESKYKWEGRGTIRPPDHKYIWDTPESLGDEITYVGDKFKKVTFEEVDITRRTATVSLYGPWGADQKPAFVRIIIDFPATYPRESKPRFDIQKTTANIADDVLRQLNAEIQWLADFSLNNKRGCLEAIISYLLGERNLNDSMKWLEVEDSAVPDLLDHMESSSEEEDEEEEDDDYPGTEELQMSGENVMISVNANANVPLPKQCGAMWSEDGRLVCFFPPRQAPKPVFFLQSLKSPHLTRNRSIFATFGRLTTSSPTPGNALASNHEDESAISTHESWASSSSSSSSSGSEEEDGLPVGRFQPPAAWRRATLKFQKSSHHSSASVVPNSANKPKSIVSILDMEDHILPCKRVLAQEYKIFGDGPSVCSHNAETARKHGFQELGDIWELCKLILNNEVPLEILPQQHRREQVLVLARRSIVSIKRKDSGLDLQFDEAEAVNNPKLRGRIKWGHHPVVNWMIPSLFEHFQKLADVQMLAMLSCIFSEPAANEGTTSAMQRLRQSQLPMSMEAPAFSLDYFSSSEAAWSLYKPTLSMPSTPAHSRFATPVTSWDKYLKPLDTYGSHGSSNGPWGSDTLPSEPVTPYSTGNTPPTLSRSNTVRSFMTSNTSTTPYSSSPEHHHVLKKSTSNLASALASFSRPFSITASSSPPIQPKPRNDGDLSTSAPTSGITWGTNTFISSGSNATNPPTRAKHGKRASFGTADRFNYDYDSEDSDWAPGEDGQSSEPAFPASQADGETTIKVKLKNQDQFDDEACVSAPLLKREDEWMYRRWREQYAEQLSIWGLVTKRAEVLKFNGLVSYWSSRPAYAGDETPETAVQLEPPIKKVARAETTPNPRSSLVPPLSDRPSIRRSPSHSPRAFSFNPEAREFQPTLKPSPIPTSFPYPHTDSQGHLNEKRGSAQSSGFKEELELDIHSSSTLALNGVTNGNNAVPKSVAEAKFKGIKTCAICWLLVTGKFYFCPACGCISHTSCVPTAAPEGCVAGCGCDCTGVGEEDGEWWERGEEMEPEMEGAEWWVDDYEDADGNERGWRNEM